MADAEDQPVLMRAGSPADLVRRMDKIEARQDEQGRALTDLGKVVERVELNQAHAVELNKLRFDALESGVKSIDSNLERFMARIEGILDGTIQTAQGTQGQKLLADYQKWHDATDERLKNLDAYVARGQGFVAAIGAGRAFVLILAGILSPVVAIVIFLLSNHTAP